MPLIRLRRLRRLKRIARVGHGVAHRGGGGSVGSPARASSGSSGCRAWRDDRAAECGGLENRCAPGAPGVRIPLSPPLSRSCSAASSVVTRAEIGPLPRRDRSQSAPRSVRTGLTRRGRLPRTRSTAPPSPSFENVDLNVRGRAARVAAERRLHWRSGFGLALCSEVGSSGRSGTWRCRIVA